MPDPILVTGAYGFMGPHVLEACSAEGHEVVASTHGDHRGRPVKNLDLCDEKSVDDVIREVRPAVVINLAGVADPGEAKANPLHAYDVNVLGQLRLIISMLRHVPSARLVTLSSAEVYGNVQQSSPVTELAPLDPYTVYGASKAAAEIQAKQFHYAEQLNVVCLRIFGTLGPGRSAAYFPGRQVHQLAKILCGESKPIVDTFSLVGGRDYVDVRDVATAIVGVIECGRSGRTYNVATGSATPLRFLIERLIAVAGVDAEIREVASPAPGRQSIIIAGDSSRLVEDTGWQPQRQLDDSLRDALAYVQDASKSKGLA
ncbi:MAG: hypothetical protein CL790_01820 [Chloroflexi bacterium]|nr:hypothetical protein [Chloroflexota bacterium]